MPPDETLALIHELRECRSKLAEYDQQAALPLKNGEN